MHAIDWEGALWETIHHLQTLIRIDTVNPPGNEMGLARYMDDVLRGAGIATTLLEPAPGRADLIARLSGTGEAKPVLLLAHMDVVGVERERWTTNPFGGEIIDDYLYGRGAIDDKGMLAVNLGTMLLLKRNVVDQGGRLTRDVVMVATSDEETGGTMGIDWLIEHHANLLDAEFALNEGGRIREEGGRSAYCAVQCAEKVPHVVRVTAHGTSGHASVPLAGNAIVRLSRALTLIGAHAEPVKLTEVTRRFFAGLADLSTDERQRKALNDIAANDPARLVSASKVIAESPNLDAVIRTGISPTMLSAGIRANVLPAQATAILNVRTLPGESIDAVLGRLHAAVDDPDVEFEVTSRGDDAPPSPADSPMFSAIASAVEALDPRMHTMPYLSTGATDSAPLRRMGIQAYGVLPFPLTREDESRMHGHDERVPIASLSFGVRLVFDVIRRLAVAQDAT